MNTRIEQRSASGTAVWKLTIAAGSAPAVDGAAGAAWAAAAAAHGPGDRDVRTESTAAAERLGTSSPHRRGNVKSGGGRETGASHRLRTGAGTEPGWLYRHRHVPPKAAARGVKGKGAAWAFSPDRPQRNASAAPSWGNGVEKRRRPASAMGKAGSISSADQHPARRAVSSSGSSWASSASTAAVAPAVQPPSIPRDWPSPRSTKRSARSPAQASSSSQS